VADNYPRLLTSDGCCHEHLEHLVYTRVSKQMNGNLGLSLSLSQKKEKINKKLFDNISSIVRDLLNALHCCSGMEIGKKWEKGSGRSKGLG